MGFRIGSFNMYKFSNGSGKDLTLIAKILTEQKLDIVALQEVFDSEALERLCRNMGPNWDCRWGTPDVAEGKYSKSSKEAEGYGFIWNTNTMELAYADVYQNGKLVKRISEPTIFNQYRIDPKYSINRLARNPYYGRFKPIRCNCEIRVINTHIRFGSDDDSSVGMVIQRRGELDTLLRSVYHKISKRRYGNNLPAYTILAGDYNLNLNRDWTKGHGSYLFNECIEIDDGSGHVQYISTIQDALTTLRQPSTTNNEPVINGDRQYYANNYDHFSIDRDRFTGIYTKPHRIDTVRKYTGEDVERHRKKISDHVPIYLNINLRNVPDDLNEE